MNAKKLEASNLQTLKASSPTAERVLRMWKERERDTRGPHHTIDLRRFKVDLEKNGGPLDLNEYARVLGELEKMGAGAVVVGKEGGIKEFRLHYPIKDIGKAAFGEVAQVLPLEKPAQKRHKRTSHKPVRKEPNVALSVPTPQGSQELIYPMGNQLVRLIIPASASKAELERFAEVIRLVK